MFGDSMGQDDGVAVALACAFCGEFVKPGQEHNCREEEKQCETTPSTQPAN